MLCERCKIREANIKYTEVINGVKTEHNLCSQCAKELDFGQYSALLDGEFPLGKLLSGLLGLEDDEEETDVRGNVVCPTCGTSFEDFVENSRFGCADCYGVFDLFIKDFKTSFNQCLVINNPATSRKFTCHRNLFCQSHSSIFAMT